MRERSNKSLTITETLRNAIADGEVPFLQLEKQTGVLRQSLMKFARGEQSLMLDAADKLAEFFGLELAKRKEK
jgi:transcriptional regulator with XRE-family HTH domain